MLFTNGVGALQVIVNCYAPFDGGFVMLRKPRRGWWYLPGGKVEPGESWRLAAMREFAEETGLELDDADLRGVYEIHIAAGPDEGEKRRIIAQFFGRGASGSLHTVHREGTLAVVTKMELSSLPMDEGDRIMLLHAIAAEERGDDRVFFGSFSYDAEHRLLRYEMDPDGYPLEPLFARSQEGDVL
ncbi:NUDIX domain-containing protein [Alicyclobacillus mali]|uniref:NUDIX domain-containing protein n=1 Tax=Alicyclobacillus mali (ex Roth et al. 2021) TaxID=1123961 RepID=A0ABS0F5H5_9BACL|nr:NUDIX domain-containing protein [Alicyclobacillus mali (ex Roth et al. 2021)]MCL6488653.1 NUDIX domain-containing protein [Alicyclobacillus mali (ex Roth et al. 2021)]